MHEEVVRQLDSYLHQQHHTMNTVKSACIKSLKIDERHQDNALTTKSNCRIPRELQSSCADERCWTASRSTPDTKESRNWMDRRFVQAMTIDTAWHRFCLDDESYCWQRTLSWSICSLHSSTWNPALRIRWRRYCWVALVDDYSLIILVFSSNFVYNTLSWWICDCSELPTQSPGVAVTDAHSSNQNAWSFMLEKVLVCDD